MDGDYNQTRSSLGDYVRLCLLNRIITPCLVAVIIIATNLAMIYSKGGPEGVRAIIKRNALAYEEQKRNAAMQLHYPLPRWDSGRPTASDDNYAK